MCLLAGILAFPGIERGSPFLDREDEAHHFNRVVRMAKTWDLDPLYFHKPSLHFYLRLPVAAASIDWARSAGYLSSVNEIITKDPYGIAGYAFAASHPTLLKWNRAFSVGLFVLCVALTALIAKNLSGSNAVALGSGLLLAVSPDMIENAPIIGVDILMALMCLAGMYLALKAYDKFSLKSLAFCGFVCV